MSINITPQQHNASFFHKKNAIICCFSGYRVYIQGMEKKLVSITDIAEACQVSAMTVSRALRQSAKVRPETLARILAKAEELGYFKSSRLGRPAHRPATERPHRIQMILGGQGSTVSIFHSRLVNSIQRNLIRHNCECVLYSNDGGYSSFLILLAALKRQKADTVIIIGDFPESQLKTLLMTFPGAILLDNPGVQEFDSTFSSFNFDNQLAAEMMLRHLLDTGRKNILLLNGRKNHFFSEIMENAYCRILPEYGIKVDRRMIRYADFTAQSAAKVMREFMEEKLPFDAVFSNDEMALGAYRTLLSCNTAIPQEVAVAGCDDLPLGQMLYPALSTVSLDYEKLAEAAVKFILSGSDAFVPCRVLIPPQLLIRESTV